MNITLIISGVLLILDTVFIMGRSNINMGVLMPAILGIPLLLIGLFYAEAHLWLHQGAGNWVRRILIVGYSLFVLMIGVCSILITQEIHAKVPEKADAVIVLGAGVRGTRPSLALQHRLEIAADYMRENENTIAILSGGQGPQEEISEAEAMHTYMLELGIPEERMIMEDESRSTYENFKNSGEILNRKFPDGYTAIFATNDFHIYRAKIAAKRAGLGELSGMGCSSPIYILPNYYIRESMAIVRYALLGLR